ncbi:MAG TPA: DinB family protein [Ilumatobacteraceae bacterium]|nr:DinB family protein [Ilumatobacteraceae bacterium]
MTRIDPPLVNPERESLLAWLDYHRKTLAMKCEGLSADQLCQRSVPPSSMSLIGLVRHMAEVERNWFQRVLSGLGDDVAGPIFYQRVVNVDGDFDDVDPATVDADIATWCREIAEADVVIAELDLDDRRPTPDRGDLDLRWVLVHMIEEYARHNGHADLLREAIDGTTGD